MAPPADDPDTDDPDLDTPLDDLPEPEYDGTVDTADLYVDGDNPNEMDEDMFGLLCENIRANGWLGGPIIADEDGCIADGEHRWRAAQEVGLEEVPVRMYDVDDATRRLWRQQLNKIRGEHDTKRDALEYDLLLDEGLQDEVTELTSAAGEDLDDILQEIRVDTSRSPAYDYDIDHNVHFMDCVDGMREHLDDDSVDFVFTSPPYNVDLLDTGDREDRTGNYVPYADDMNDTEYREFIGDVLDELARVIKPDGHIFFNIQVDIRDGTVTPPHWVPEMMPVPWRSYVVWSKRNSSRAIVHMQDNGRFLQSWEPVYHFSEDPDPLHGRRNFAVWNVDQASIADPGETGSHPAPFPVELVKRGLEPTTEPGDLVLDPFMGSGTTAVAAIHTDRDYIGFELDDDGAYQPIVERRIRDALRQTGRLTPDDDHVDADADTDAEADD